MKFISKKNRGISLVEMIMYIALLAVITVVVIDMMVSISVSYRTVKTTRDMENSAMTSMGRMETEIRDASSIDIPNSIFNTTSSVLSLNVENGTSTATSTIRFYLTGGQIEIDQNSASSGPLTLPSVTVSSLIFRNISTGYSSGVKIELTMTATTSANLMTKKFYDTAIIRNSY